MELIKILSKVPILGSILAWYGRKAIRDGKLSIDDFVNVAMASQIEKLEKTSDEELKQLLNFMQNRDSESYSVDYIEIEKHFPSHDALEQFINRMISEIEGILFLREHRRKYKNEQ